MKEGTKVFDIRHGWGVSYDRFSFNFPIGVNFQTNQVTYKRNGEDGVTDSIFLSLTEYNFIDGGFTAIDSLKVGDMVYAWDNESTCNWLVFGKLLSVDVNRTFPFQISNGAWMYASKEVPQWFINKNK